jgi:NAD(P)-dependent dehydrogenase (short-subunit alcohol dehydrogenase family)
MKIVVVTGSTRGIGYGLAREFLRSGCKVVVSGRKTADVDKVVEKLSAISGKENVSGKTCEVSEPAQVQALWDFSISKFGHVDIWVNNAGIGQSQETAWEVKPEMTQSILRTNVEGLIHGSTVAMQGMMQQGFGAIYNMEGLGSDGRKVKGLSNYGTSKAAVRYYSKALIAEAQGTPIIIGTLQPGMVLTEMLSKEHVQDPDEWRRLRILYNFLADNVENVTRWLVKKMLSNNTNGKAIQYLTTGRIFRHTFDFVFKRRDVMKESSEE